MASYILQELLYFGKIVYLSFGYICGTVTGVTPLQQEASYPNSAILAFLI
jgi:hypothetical protein